MSEAIRCGQCRWWSQQSADDHRGWCELNPLIYVGCDSDRLSSWAQPLTTRIECCSRGEPKTQKTGGDK